MGRTGVQSLGMTDLYRSAATMRANNFITPEQEQQLTTEFREIRAKSYDGQRATDNWLPVGAKDDIEAIYRQFFPPPVDAWERGSLS